MDNTASIKNILLVFLIVLFIYLMNLLSSLLIPLAMAILFALLFYPLQLLLLKWKIPRVLTIPLILILSVILINALISGIVLTGMEMAGEQDYFAAQLTKKIDALMLWITNISNGSINTEGINKTIKELIQLQNLSGVIGDVVGTLGSFAGSFLIFLIYYIILLSGMSNYKGFLEYVAGEKTEKKFTNKFEEIQTNLVYYIKYKSLLNLATSVVYTSILFAFGIRFAIFWGILNFFLNFIPNFGSLISVLLAVLMGIIQFDSINTLLFMLGLLLVGNFVIGSVIEPKVMGDKLRLNTITVIFGLLFWGFIWGVPGMFLSVPLLVITKVIFESFSGLEPIGRIMGSPDNAKV